MSIEFLNGGDRKMLSACLGGRALTMLDMEWRQPLPPEPSL